MLRRGMIIQIKYEINMLLLFSIIAKIKQNIIEMSKKNICIKNLGLSVFLIILV